MASVEPKDKTKLHSYLLSPTHSNMLNSLAKRMKVKTKIEALKANIEQSYKAQNEIDIINPKQDLKPGEERAVSKSASPTGIASNFSEVGRVRNDGRIVWNKRKR